jgi:tetratricopeptide (TPR) repeat protein/KaiC/GvpD/RAD55 family RecA-like ATPase
MSTVLAEPTFVGSELERTQLNGCLKTALEGKGSTVFLSGQAGSGKSRLANDFIKTAKEQDVTILSGSCFGDIAIPYFLFMEAFRDYFTTQDHIVDDSGIRNWLLGPAATKSRDSEYLSPQAWKDQTFMAVTDWLLSIASKKTTLLFLEDVHWADSASLSLLHYLARATKYAGVMILATFRSEELTADSEGHPHPLLESLRLMGREGLFKEIKLAGLSTLYVERIAVNMIGGKLDPGLINKLTMESQGNPLFVVESLRMLNELGSLVKENNLWRLGTYELGVPSKYRDIILRRLGSLKANMRRMLDMASVVGDKFNPEMLGFVLDQDALDVLEALNSISQLTSLVHPEGDLYRFDHAKTRMIIYQEIPSLLKKGYHARIAKRLEGLDKQRKELLLSDLAYHYSQAGNNEKAVEYALEAGDDALARFSNVEAIKHFQFVLKCLSEESEQAKRTRALQGLGEAYFANSMFGDALKTFEQIYANETGLPRLIAYRWAMDSAFFKGDIIRLAELEEKAENCATIDRVECARVRMNKGRTNLMKGKPKEGLEDFEEALRVDEEEYALQDVARTLVGMGPAYGSNGLQEKAIVAELRAIALYEDLHDLRGQMDACNRAGQNAFRGLKEEALSMYQRAISIGEKIADYNRVAEAMSSLATVYENSDELPAALSHSLRALDYCQKTDSGWIVGLTYANLIRQYTKKGDLVAAGQYLAKVNELMLTLAVASTKTIIQQGRNMLQNLLSRAVFLAGNNQWQESNEMFNKIFSSLNINSHLAQTVMASYFWALEKQGLFAEAEDKRKQFFEVESRGLEKFNHANTECHIMMPVNVNVGQQLEARIDIVNVSKTNAALNTIENLPTKQFEIAAKNHEWTISDDTIDLKNITLKPFGIIVVKLVLKPFKAFTGKIALKLAYADDLANNHICKSNSVQVNVNPIINIRVDQQETSIPILPGRVTTGLLNVDALLYGGIPEGYSIILSSTPNDEMKKIIESFLQAGKMSNEPTFYLTENPESAKLVTTESPNVFIFLCNRKSESSDSHNLNIFTLKGLENLTDIDIAILRASRSLAPSYTGPKRALIEVTSDALLQHGALIARKWLGSLILDLKKKGFTTLATVNPQMHSKEDLQAVLSLFEGQLEILDHQNEKGTEKWLRVVRLQNQKYFSQEIPLMQVEGR